ncbi:other/IRE protein kinase [Coprinopsis cinerea okayama7|uniref:non-specific serine/threonine protein kinase n=1 Tax=Coprinopsis cinerea (strain Okayama-7 / 130 / ATCC MYA-4618 / FGSC 9003) TaxID=240176 RepID=A8NZQ7_COPC7|nr:other/IRE protein kinase [Coprinopsis cinerea okayama7\|eukprot:XP_001837725.1 other/IRE protein kinase [Coprinopsis cinerea okayama7\
MAFVFFLQFLLLIVGAVCWAEIVNVRSTIPAAETAALIQRTRPAPTYATGGILEPTKDLELLDIVLVASIDGKFHALSRSTGKILWSMPAFARAEGSSTLSSLAPLVRTTHPENDPDDFDDDTTPETYIIEPQSGHIYVVNSEDDSLQRFPFSMAELVDMSPFTSPGDDEKRVFIGRKETSLLLLELETGRIKATLNSECPPYDDRRIDLDELEEPESRGSSTTEVFIGRTDYYISIYPHRSKGYGTRAPVQNLSFSVYGPNNEDNLLQANYRRTSDDAYIQGFPNGDVYSFKTKSEGGRVQTQPLWVQKFHAPTVAVFDVLRGSTPLQPHPHAFVLLQPRPRAEDVIPGLDRSLLRGAKSAYVGMVEETGSLYAMSPSHYPLVAFGDAEEGRKGRLIEGSGGSAQSIHDIIRNQKEADRRIRCEDNPRDRECLLGMHPLDETDGHESRMRRLLEGPSSISPIPTFRPGQNQWIDHGIEVVPNIEAPPNNSQQPATPVPPEEVRKTGWEYLGVTLGLGLVSLWFLFKKFGQREGFKVPKFIPVPNGDAQIARPLAPIPDTATEPAPAPEPATVQPLQIIPEQPAPPAPLPLPLPPLEDPTTDALAGTGEEGDDTDREGDPEPETVATPGRKKPRRGKRGKKKKKDATPIPGEEGVEGKAPNGPDGPAANGTPNINPPDNNPDATIAPAAPQSPSLVVSSPIIPAAAGPSLVVSDTILGFGSHGTVVFQGSLQGRAVAVKRLLKDFVTLASREVSILQESDDHPNVIRYYYQEAHANFLYIALELCPASLADIIETPDREAFRDIAISFDPKRALKQITSGLKHLHALKLVHRDIKPQNILITTNKSTGRGRPTYRMLISDFGLCKKLDVDQTSFLPTMNGGMGAGTVGWRAPEILRGEVKLDDLSDDHSMSSRGSVSTINGSSSSSSTSGLSTAKPTRLTKSVDIFALGCLYYYTLTNGSHPYGDRFEREVNILKDAKSLDLLERFGEEGTEACDLIEKMLDPEASERPDTTACLLHPFFWDPARRLNFLQDASDRFEIMCRDPKDPLLLQLETGALAIVGNDWHARLDRLFVENLGKFRKYDGKSVQDLLRALRNKKHHYQDLPDNVKRSLGPMPEGFLAYFTKRFPRLFLHVHRVISDTVLRTESMFRSYFELPDS